MPRSEAGIESKYWPCVARRVDRIAPVRSTHLAVSKPCSYYTTAAATVLERQANPSTISSPTPAIAAPAREIAG